MGSIDKPETGSGTDLAKRMAEREEGLGRRPSGLAKYIIPTIAVSWSLFQLSIASWLILDSTFIRSIHLAFALLIVYLNFPVFTKRRFGLDFLSTKTRIPVFDFIIGIIAALCALYIAIDYEGLTFRYGDPILRDIVIGVMLVFLLLEAARRVIGPALSDHCLPVLPPMPFSAPTCRI
jgi:TRAP-type uncharacterized transport system fused permease subunit